MEVRWFYAGTIPRQMVQWFHQGEREPEEQPGRVDYYLRLGDIDALGIKLREGRIEVKQRQHQHGVVRFREQVAGRVEHWRKWSLGLVGVDHDWTDLLAPASSWVGVRKERRLRIYQVTDGGEILAVPAGEYPQQGCGLELTAVVVGGRPWWSLAFEAFGPEPTLQQNLLLVVKHVLARAQAPVLTVRNSYGYPRWLEAVIPPLPPHHHPN